MSKESDFVDKLTDFTSALENLVEILQEQIKSNPSEVFNKFMENMDAASIKNIEDSLTEIKVDVKNINKTSEKTLEIVKGIKDSKETGMFGEIETGTNKDKVIAGVKTVVLIAAGVLAIGMAFKIVGDVDFMSVVSLGLGIMFVAMAFSKVASIKDDKGKSMDMKTAILTSLIMIIMSGAILVSGMLLQLMPELSLGTLITIIGVGAGMGLATYFLLKGLGKLKTKDLGMAIFAPLILPLIAQAIVWSGEILQDMPSITMEQVLGALGVGVALAPIAISFGFMMKGLKGATPVEILMGSASIILISAAIMISSWILSVGNYDGNYPNWKWGASVGLSILAFSIPMIILGVLAMAGVGLPALGLAMIAIPMVVATIVIASLLLPLGSYEKYPNASWAAGVGLSILAFGIPMMLLGVFIFSTLGFGLAMVVSGGAAMLIIATTIVAASKILSTGTYEKYPSLKWSQGVALSIRSFSDVLAKMTGMSILSNIFGGNDVDLESFIITISKAMVIAGKEFQGADNVFGGNFPTKEWAEGVGGSIMAFALALESQGNEGGVFQKLFGKKQDLKTFITEIVGALITAGEKFKDADKGTFGGNFPKKEWAEGVGGSILAFAQAIKALDDAGVDIDADDLYDDDGAIAIMLGLVNGLFAVGKLFNTKNKDGNFFDVSTTPNDEWVKNVSNAINIFTNIKQDGVDPLELFFKALDDLTSISWNRLNRLDKVAEAIRSLRIEINKLNIDKVNSLMSLGAGFQLLSLVDEEQLENVLDVIDAKKKTITQVVDNNGVMSDVFDKLFHKTGTQSEPSTFGGPTIVPTEEKSFETILLEHVANIDTNIESMSTITTTEREEVLDAKDVEE